VKEGSGKGLISPWLSLLGNLEKALSRDFERQVIVCRDPSLVLWERCTRRPWKQASVFVGALLGGHGGGTAIPVILRER